MKRWSHTSSPSSRLSPSNSTLRPFISSSMKLRESFRCWLRRSSCMTSRRAWSDFFTLILMVHPVREVVSFSKFENPGFLGPNRRPHHLPEHCQSAGWRDAEIRPGYVQGWFSSLDHTEYLFPRSTLSRSLTKSSDPPSTWTALWDRQRMFRRIERGWGIWSVFTVHEGFILAYFSFFPKLSDFPRWTNW